MAYPSAPLLFSLLLSLSLLTFSGAVPTQTLANAAEILSDSGYHSMSLTLDLASRAVVTRSQSLTVFTPADAAFDAAGQLTLSLLDYHLLPHAFTLRSLRSLPYGAKVSTLLSGYALTVTTSPAGGPVSLNNVTLTESPIFDDGSLIIYGTNDFFDPYFKVSGPIRSFTNKSLGCFVAAPLRKPNKPETASYDPIREATTSMRYRGLPVMAAFLDMIPRALLNHQAKITVLAPIDQSLVTRIRDFSEYSTLLRRHVIPCLVSWSDLTSLTDGATLRTDLEGFVIRVTRYGPYLLVNGITVILPEIYSSDRIVVHGISGVLTLQQWNRRVGPEYPTEQTEQVVDDDDEAFAEGLSTGEDETSAAGTTDQEPKDEVADEEASAPGFANSTTEYDESGVSHQRFFVYRPA